MACFSVHISREQWVLFRVWDLKPVVLCELGGISRYGSEILAAKILRVGFPFQSVGQRSHVSAFALVIKKGSVGLKHYPAPCRAVFGPPPPRQSAKLCPTFVVATPNARSPWNFQRLISVTVSINCISQNFHIGDSRSGKFCNLYIISKWEKIERRLFWTKTIRNALKHWITGRLDTLSRNIANPPYIITKVISGHKRSPAVFRQ